MIWLLACQVRSPQQSDRQAYITYTTADRTESADLCEDISESALRADCLIHAAARHARVRDIETAQATCQRIEAGIWRDECWFLTADDANLIGEAALSACRNSGRFQPHCRGHALGRAAQEVDLTVGLEAESARAIGKLVADYRPKSAGLKRRIMANEILAVRIGDRWQAAPFDPMQCGALTPPMCAWAYRASLDDATAPLGDLCDQGISNEAAQDIGLSGWSEAGESMAWGVWSGICQQVADGESVDLKPAKLPAELMDVGP